jgi:hypothetical protein
LLLSSLIAKRNIDREFNERAVAFRTSTRQKLQKEIKDMPLYEVTYEEAGEMKSEVIEAPGPVEATRLFREQNRDRQVSVVCVVLQ